jgi:hypothetical protein
VRPLVTLMVPSGDRKVGFRGPKLEMSGWEADSNPDRHIQSPSDGEQINHMSRLA